MNTKILISTIACTLSLLSFMNGSLFAASEKPGKKMDDALDKTKETFEKNKDKAKEKYEKTKSKLEDLFK